MSTYSDKNITLNNIALTQFELAREIPAAIDLFAKNPQNLDIQTRSIILKINAALHNLKTEEQFTLAIGLDFLSFVHPMMAFLHSDKKQNGDTKFSVRELCQRDKIFKRT